MNIEAIDPTSPYLATVKALGKANAAPLGVFPEGAFEDYARRKTILVALDEQDNCVGYLLCYAQAVCGEPRVALFTMST